MNFFYYFTTILISVLSVVVTNCEVLEYPDEEFQALLSEHNNALVLFYADWCRHCEAFKPDFLKAEEIAREKKMDVQFIKVNCASTGQKTCREFGIRSYPRVKYFVDGDVKEAYKSKRNANAIVKYLSDKLS